MEITSPIVNFLVVVAALIIAIASTFFYPASYSIFVFLLVTGSWLVLTAFLTRRRRGMTRYPASAVRSLYGGLMLSISIAGILFLGSVDWRIAVIVFLAGIGLTGVAFYLLAKQ
jgi:hypothetical protein